MATQSVLSNRRSKVKNALKAFAVTLAVLFAAVSINSRIASADYREELRVIGEVLRLIDTQYLNPVDLKKCRYDMLHELTRRLPEKAPDTEAGKKAWEEYAKEEFVCLDKFSGFAEPVEAKDQNDDIQGHFGGVGMELTQESGRITVVAPIEGTPAALAGIQPKDIVTAIRQEGETQATPVTDITKAVKMIRGKPGTKIYVTVERAGKTFEVGMTRAEIRVSAVKKKDLPGGIGYIKVTSFTSTMVNDLDLALASFRKNGPNPMVVLDLRGNPGGLLWGGLETLYLFNTDPNATMLTERFRNRTEVHTIGKPNLPLGDRFWDPETCTKADDESTCATRKPGKYANYKIVILIDGGSASASEIVAGTMKDWGYTIVGTNSYKKGVGQTLFPLSDGSVLRLTTFEFLVGNSKTKIHEIGVQPTVEVKDTRGDVSENDENGKPLPPEKLFEKKARAIMDNTATANDAQFMKALELLKK